MEQQLYDTTLLIGASINLMIAFVLLHNNYWYRDYEVYHRSRQFSALVYLAFAVGFLLHAHYAWRTAWPAAASALSVTYFHIGAVFFGWSHTSLLKPDYLTRRIVVRDLMILMIGIISYWMAVANSSLFILHLSFSIFFLHAPYIAFTFYRTYYRVRRSLSSRTVDGNAPRWWTEEAKREVLSLHHSFVIACHLIILFGLGSIVVTALFPTAVWPYTVLLCLGIAVFCYIFYALEEYGAVIESATNATEDLSKKQYKYK